MKRIIVFALCVAAALSLASCSLGDSFLAAMGFDTHDYGSEEIIETVSPDDKSVDALREMIKMLSINDPRLPEFSSSGEALDKCRDAILNYMLNTGFAKYTGNLDLIFAAQENYPELQLITVIPAEDFENCVYTYFGGNAKLSHRDSELFAYLEKADCYTAVTVPIENNVTVNVIRCERTERTYRLKFTCTLGGVTSPVYDALIVNRTDGSSYFKRLKIS